MILRNELERSLIRSALSLRSPFIDLKGILEWIEDRKAANPYRVQPVDFAQLRGWHFDCDTSNLTHQSGGFFSIDGIDVRTNWGNVNHWQQPIINQPEIGFLGIICKIHEGIIYFLLQAKIEPGNINGVQLAPTLQATKSNYMQVHQGKAPSYLEDFRSPGDSLVILDQLQSEQGARFLRKRNRNVILAPSRNNADRAKSEDYIWLTLGQIKHLLRYDNVINMDTRTVLSGITFQDKSLIQEFSKDFSKLGLALLQSEIDTTNPLHDIEHIISWITRLKSTAELVVTPTPLNSLDHWVVGKSEIRHKDHKYFSVIGLDIEIGNREVSSWSQPIVKSAQEGIIAFLIKKINNVYHFLVQAKMEPGNFDLIELAPSIQCLTGNYRSGENEYEVPFIQYTIEPENLGAKVLYSTLQSEEGGRFFLEQNRNMLIEAPNTFPQQLPENYIWMTLHQLKTFLRFNNYLNIQARSLLAIINYI